jgi:hypothetical protein
MRIRTCLVSAVYRKSLVLSNYSKKDTTTGEIVNLMAVDSQRFIDLLPWLNSIWTAPVQAAIALWLLWLELGPSVIGGLLLMIAFIPINVLVANKVKQIQAKQMKLKDQRLKAMNEILSGIKVLKVSKLYIRCSIQMIKFLISIFFHFINTFKFKFLIEFDVQKLYAWEEAFIQNILGIRAKELKYLRKSGYLGCVFVCTFSCATFSVSFVTFAIYILIDENNKLDAQKAFVSIALLSLLRVSLAKVSNMISFVVQVNILNIQLNFQILFCKYFFFYRLWYRWNVSTNS